MRWRLATADDTPPPTLDDYITAWMERDRLRGVLLDWMEGVPFIIAPVGATPALAHGQHKVTVEGQTASAFRAFSYCQTFNVFDLPVVVVPAGRSDDRLPIGVQIAGRPGDEERLLNVASVVEAAVNVPKFGAV